MGSDRSFAVVIAAFATVTYAAVLFATFGVITVLINREPISTPDAGPLVGPSMFAVAALVTFSFLAWLGVGASAPSLPNQRRRVSVWLSLLTGLAAYVAYLVAGGILLANTLGASFDLVSYPVRMLGSPFTISAGVFAFVVALLYQLVIAGRFRDRAQPQWPWERDDDE